MKTVYFEKLPRCDYENLDCTGNAVYDAPTIDGPWAHMCEHHYKIFAASMADKIGCKLAQRDKVEEKSGEAQMGIEPNYDDLEYWENVLIEGLREIKCPECSESRSMEPDATGVFTCEGCGIRVKCPSPIF